MLRYQHAVNNSSRQGRLCSTLAAVRPPAVALAKPYLHAVRYLSAGQGFSSCLRSPAVLGPATTSASRACALVYDSDDYEWEDYEGDWNNGVGTAEVPAASGMVASAAAAPAREDAAHSSTSGQAASAHSKQRQGRNKQHPEAQQQQQQQEGAAVSAEYSFAGGGIVGVFVAGWMALIALVLRVLQPVMSLALMLTQPLTNVSPARAKHQLQKLAAELPEGFWAKLHFLWELPVVRSIRITLSVANWGVRLPAIAALLLTQGSLLASQVSLPMLAPLLLGTGMMMNSIKKNASFIFPRVGLLVVLLWLLWFANSVIQNTWLVLRNQGRIDARTMSGARMITECSSLLLAGILVLSALGINISALLLPTGVVLAIASKDLLQNLIAGLYLVLVQPFRLGDKVAVSCSLPSSAAQGGNSKVGLSGLAAGAGSSSSRGGGALSAMQGWFEGVCEKVDLRYTVLRDGRRRLMVPNTAFVSREFLVYDDGPTDIARPGSATGSSAADSRSSSPWPGSSSNASNQREAEAASREPVIREGHMATELPPLAPPIFPGMTLVGPPPGYGQMQYAPQGYAAVPYPAGYGQMQQMQEEQQQEDQDGQGQYEQDQQQEQRQQGKQGAGSAADGGNSSSQGQQRQGSISSGNGNKARRATVAKGPPGYLPQGYTAGQYLGIPVYWTLPGMLGPWTGGAASGHQQQQQQQPHQQQQQQQHFEQQYYDYHEPAGMHQPVPAHYPLPSHLPQQNTHNPWEQQAQMHWQQQQQLQQAQQQQAQQLQQQQQRATSQQSAGPSMHQRRRSEPQREQSRNGTSSGGSSDRGSGGNDKAKHNSSGELTWPSSQGSHGNGNGKANGSSSQVVDGSTTPQGFPDVKAQQQQRQERGPDYHQNAVHVAGLGVGGYTFWGGAVPPDALHQHLQYQHYSPAVQLQFMPVQQYQPPSGHMQQPVRPFEHDISQATAAGPGGHMHRYSSNGNTHHQPHGPEPQQEQHQQNSTDSTAAAVGPAPDPLPASVRASPIDQLAAAHSLEPATVAAASAGGVAGLSMQSLQPITGGVTAAASAAAVAGSAASSVPAQQFGTMATEAAGQMWRPIVGMCEEIGQGLSEL